MRGGLARHIVLQATLQEDDLYMRQWTDRTYGPHLAEPSTIDPDQEKQARERAKLLAVTTDEKLDTAVIENETYRQAFENYHHFFANFPDQKQALTALRRMFVKREQINRQLGLQTFQTDAYALVIMALATEV